MSEQNQEQNQVGIIDDSAIIPPGWVWTPEESAGIELDLDALTDLIKRLLAEGNPPAPQATPAQAIGGLVQSVVEAVAAKWQV